MESKGTLAKYDKLYDGYLRKFAEKLSPEGGYVPSRAQMSMWSVEELASFLDWIETVNPFIDDLGVMTYDQPKPAVLTMSLETRMKRYEGAQKTYLNTDLPIMIRLDGKSFSAFTKRFNKPFDAGITRAMDAAMLALCKEIQPVLFGYTQSDEITLVLGAYERKSSMPWFNGNVQKIVSVSASIATAAFNRSLLNSYGDPSIVAYFDARVWNVPEEHEVINTIVWRENDAIRNSVAMVASSVFSHSQLHKVNVEGMKQMLIENGTPWEDFPLRNQRGALCYPVTANGQRKKWIVDSEIPILSTQREFLYEFMESGTLSS